MIAKDENNAPIWLQNAADFLYRVFWFSPELKTMYCNNCVKDLVVPIQVLIRPLAKIHSSAEATFTQALNGSLYHCRRWIDSCHNYVCSI